jgi:NAD(P)-dependent dehydrogenase (short-subunit alcohol dehydrogenase family)
VVYATARQIGTLADLAEAGCRTAAVDVTDEASMVSVVDAIVAEHGRVGALVNNAGYGEYGAIEDVAIEKVRQQFETNVFGLVRMTQLVLPSMRQAGAGRIVNIGSVGGRLTFPYGFPYGG